MPRSRSPSILTPITMAIAVVVAPANALASDEVECPDGGLPAFPGAEGFGACVTGGRGGAIYHVTQLGDSGPGSFRDAVSRGPRVVVFDVGGYVALSSPVSVRSDITILGQTAPGEGIGIRGREVSFSGSHNVIARYLRFRQGLADNQKKSAVALYQSDGVILDHVSIEWGRWDTVDMGSAKNVTIQHSIIGEGIAPQRFGAKADSITATFSHDLFISNHSRNPKAKGDTQFVSNVVYDWQLDAYIAGGNSAGEHRANVVGNYFIEGPASGSHGPISGGNALYRMYAADNYFDDDATAPLGGRALVDADLGPVTIEATPFDYPYVTVDAPADAYAVVVAGVGASLHRDEVDARLVDDLVNKTGGIISDPAEVGGFGSIASGAAPASCAGDGLPDAWKLARGLDPCTPAAGDDTDGTGYTNIEVYAQELVDSGG